MKRLITKTELRQHCFRQNGHIHVGFFIGDEPFFSVISKNDIIDYLNRHPDKAKKYNRFFMCPETVAIDMFVNEEVSGILAPELKMRRIDVYYRNQLLNK